LALSLDYFDMGAWMEGVKPGVGVVLDEERTVGWTTSPVRTRGSAFATAVHLAQRNNAFRGA
jgi:hypothetical protein